uniref:Uncharacterized protein n=1 Tax=Spodoptera litura male-killing virus TaxID=2996810 RepID=A0AA86IVL4_9VIRU|nr:hypothetical protein [Spodoptera litura male-killing virus]
MAVRRRIRRSFNIVQGVLASASRTVLSPQFIVFFITIIYIHSDDKVLSVIVAQLNKIAPLKPIATYINSHKVQASAIISCIAALFASNVSVTSSLQPLAFYLAKEQGDYRVYIPSYFLLTWWVRTRSQRLRIVIAGIILALYSWGLLGVTL